MKSVKDIEDLHGILEVNEKCVGAMSCRALAPNLFEETPPNDKDIPFTRVSKDVRTEEEYLQARQAIYVCPNKAIKWKKNPKGFPIKPLWENYPKKLEDNVYICGYINTKNISCLSYLIVRENGNVLVDPPSADNDAIEAIKKLGGVKYLFITHQDHGHDHEEWHKATGCTRIIHQDDVISNPSSFHAVTTSVEIKLQGHDVQYLDGNVDLKLLPVPGHTPGTTVLIYNDKFLFAGDHLRYSVVEKHIVSQRLQCWQDWGTQIESNKKLLKHDFLWILPGHGDLHRFETVAEARDSLAKGIEWMQKMPMGKTAILRFVLFITLIRKGYSQAFAKLFLPWDVQNTTFPTKPPLPVSLETIFSTIVVGAGIGVFFYLNK